jgi:methylase of polypeptide subunit release factors
MVLLMGVNDDELSSLITSHQNQYLTYKQVRMRLPTRLYRTAIIGLPKFTHANFMDLKSKEVALIRLLDILKSQDYQFITITPSSHERVNNRPDNQWAKNVRDIFGWNRPFRRDAIPDDLFEILESAELISPFWDGWQCRIRVSSLDGHLFVHSAFPTVENDAIFFGPDTYRFMKAIRNHLKCHTAPVTRVADIGCGCGAGAILVGLEIPDAEILALDINDKAISATAINAKLAGAKNVIPLYSDILKGTEGEFDLIIANPPYLIDGSYRAYRHGGGPLGEEISMTIVNESIQHLRPQGTLLLYAGVAIVEGKDLFIEEINKRVDKADFKISYTELDPDIFGEELQRDCYWDVDRIACMLLTITREQD